MWKFYIWWNNWSFGKTLRLNGSLMWGYNPYISYRIGPVEIRKYQL